MKTQKKIRLLVTAGPTREHFDPVRFLSNLSTGEMGYRIAEEARKSGKFDVVLITGPTSLKPPLGVKTVSIISAAELKKACEKYFLKSDIVIMVAAVCDFTATKVKSGKIKRESTKALHLKRTPDIVAGLAKKKKSGQAVIGFCLETEDWISRGWQKCNRKKLDGIVANQYGSKNIPFGARSVTMAFIDKNKRVDLLKNRSKSFIAKRLLSWSVRLREA